MSTSGVIGIVEQGHWYGTYYHYDMYPSGHPASLASEATAYVLQENGWGQVLSATHDMLWVADADRDTHTQEEMQDLAKFANKDELLNPTKKWGRSHIFPEDFDGYKSSDEASWTVFSSERVLRKEPFPKKGSPAMYAVIADHDSNLFLCYSVGHKGSSPLIGSSKLDHLSGLTRLSASARGSTMNVEQWQYHADEDALSEAHMDLESFGEKIADGMWNRPPGFKELHNTPAIYPAHPVTGTRPDLALTSEAELHANENHWKTIQVTTDRLPNISAKQRCHHIGRITKQRCVRFRHNDVNHRYT